MSERKDLELIEFHELIGDESTGHVFCMTCNPHAQVGQLVIANCGAVHRCRGLLVKDHGTTFVSCATCFDIKFCSTCGKKQMP